VPDPVPCTGENDNTRDARSAAVCVDPVAGRKVAGSMSNTIHCTMSWYGEERDEAGWPRPWYHYLVVASPGPFPDSAVAYVLSLDQGERTRLLVKSGGAAAAVRAAEAALDARHARLKKVIGDSLPQALVPPALDDSAKIAAPIPETSDRIQQLFLLEGHEQGVGCVAWSPNGRFILSSAFAPEEDDELDPSPRLWDPANGKPVRQLDGHERPVIRVAFPPDSRRALCADRDGVVILWDVESGEDLQRFEDQGEVGDLLVTPDGRHALIAAKHGMVRVVDLTRGLEVRQTQIGMGPNPCLTFSSDGRSVLVGSDYGFTYYNAVSGRNLVPLYDKDGKQGRVTCLALSHDGRRAASGRPVGTMCMWDLAGGQQLHHLSSHEGAVRGIDFAPDGQRLLSASMDGTLRLWDVETGKELSRFADYPALLSVAYAPDGKHAVTGGDDCSVRVWRLPEIASGPSPAPGSSGVGMGRRRGRS
jgi:hypothetical protein